MNDLRVANFNVFKIRLGEGVFIVTQMKTV